MESSGRIGIGEMKPSVTHLDLVTDLEALVFEHQLLEPLGQLDMVTYVVL